MTAVPITVRQVKYLNNNIEQDHRAIKRATRPMLGFKSFQHARRVLAGVELIHKLKKGQYGVPFSFGITSNEIWCNVLAS